MSEERKRPSWFEKLQPRKYSCCNAIIEELDDESEHPSCCGNSAKGHGAPFVIRALLVPPTKNS